MRIPSAILRHAQHAEFPDRPPGHPPAGCEKVFPRRTRRWAPGAAQSRRQEKHSSRGGAWECGSGNFAHLVEQAFSKADGSHRKAGEAEHARLLEEDRQKAQKLHRRAVPWNRSKEGASENGSRSPGGRERR